MNYTDFDQNKIKHLEMIQSIITRMNSNSFLIKGWAITIVSAVLALLGSTKNPLFVILTGVPILIFWVLDSFYLQIERKFITLYNKTISDTAVQPFILNVKNAVIGAEKRHRYQNCFFSRTILWFYLLLLIIATGCVILMYLYAEVQGPLEVKIIH